MPIEYQMATVVAFVGAAVVAAAMAWGRRNASFAWPLVAGIPEVTRTTQGAAHCLIMAMAEIRRSNGGKPVAPFRADVIAAAIELAETQIPGKYRSDATHLLQKACSSGQVMEARRKALFEDSEEANMQQLESLWSNAGFPASDFARRSDLWAQLGFQGKDPVTDLRGGGCLALDFMVHLSSADTALLRDMMEFNAEQLAEGDMSWFLTAVVSIQFSTRLLLGEVPFSADHLESILADGAGVQRGLMRTHVDLMRSFFCVWKDKRPSVMEYTQFVEPNVINPFFEGATTMTNA
jgi:hypothetical protein